MSTNQRKKQVVQCGVADKRYTGHSVSLSASYIYIYIGQPALMSGMPRQPASATPCYPEVSAHTPVKRRRSRNNQAQHDDAQRT